MTLIWERSKVHHRVLIGINKVEKLELSVRTVVFISWRAEIFSLSTFFTPVNTVRLPPELSEVGDVTFFLIYLFHCNYINFQDGYADKGQWQLRMWAVFEKHVNNWLCMCFLRRTDSGWHSTSVHEHHEGGEWTQCTWLHKSWHPRSG